MSRACPSGPTSSHWTLHLLNVPSAMAPQPGDYGFNTRAFGGMSRVQTTPVAKQTSNSTKVL